MSSRLRNRQMLPSLPALPRLFATSKLSLHRSLSTFAEPPTRITTLPNKIKVATNDVAAHIQAVGVTVAAGSRYETDETRGFSYMLSKLAFKSSSNRSVTDYALDMERYVSTLACHVGRETLLYQAHFPSQNLSPVLSLVSDTMLHPLITPGEVEESLLGASYELMLYDEKADAFLMEVLQNVAFGKKALGRPNLPDPVDVDFTEQGIPPIGTTITPERLQAFRKLWFRPERIVVSGTGMEHDELVKLTEAQFGHLPYVAPIQTGEDSARALSTGWFKSLASSLTPISSPEESVGGLSAAGSMDLIEVPPIGQPAAVYTGGVDIDVRPGMEMCHVFVGFEGLDANDEDVYALAVIQMLLGDGASFSSGGPGKGLLSRFYTGVMIGSHGLENVNSMNLPYSDGGLFAVSLTCMPGVLQKYLNRLAVELASIMKPHNLTYPVQPIELSRAKNRLKSAMLYAQEDPRVEAEDLGAQVMINGKRMPIKEMLAKIDAVSMGDLARVANRVFARGNSGKGKLTVVARGPETVSQVESMVNRAWSSKGLYVGPGTKWV
ncbi:Mitochondrial processing peptidase, alpha subunit [Phaffia rhodozyma]|uniref:Mitochondrial processing peptidase, alpha subunit n=1 Tax=Phaffia rhodozyma TaxID=264483 RepID=A0A0F7SSW7_PHARH|nr:Mitochondrial processing peptidase, alpha subunit [Phaffia rhodozyma]